MAEDLPNLDKLIKLLKMTTSNNDSEALVAMRMANAALVKFGGDWERLLRGKVTVIGDPFSSIPTPPSREAPPPPQSKPRYNPPPPPPPKPSRPAPASNPFSPSPATPIPNRFAGTCRLCGTKVGERAGFAVHLQGKWKVECSTCHTQGPPIRKPRPPMGKPKPSIDDLIF